MLNTLATHAGRIVPGDMPWCSANPKNSISMLHCCHQHLTSPCTLSHQTTPLLLLLLLLPDAHICTHTSATGMPPVLLLAAWFSTLSITSSMSGR
jgi:hypothetical protein